MKGAASNTWVAHASRGWATPKAFGFGETPKPTRETRALPSDVGGRAFTIVELLIVIAIILVLAGLILATSGYVQTKGRRSRAEAEIAAISAALENYKADNGVYPSDNDTKALDPTTTTPNSYKAASSYLYSQMTGDDDADPTTPPPTNPKNYFGSALKPNMLGPSPPGPNTYLRDPFGNSYGYSTAKADNPGGTVGYNPTFDLWSTANSTIQSEWIKNW
jgi:prepilin-type N-terminal cleavage/methylation domain-containing protein